VCVNVWNQSQCCDGHEGNAVAGTGPNVGPVLPKISCREGRYTDARSSTLRCVYRFDDEYYSVDYLDRIIMLLWISLPQHTWRF
jgi:hypothetical protein